MSMDSATRTVSFQPHTTTPVMDEAVSDDSTVKAVDLAAAMGDFLQGQLQNASITFNETNGSLQQIQAEIQERQQRMADLRAQLLGKQGELQALRLVQAKLTELAQS